MAKPEMQVYRTIFLGDRFLDRAEDLFCQHFSVVEIAGDEMYFETLTRTGRQIDSGVLRRPVRTPPPANAGSK